MTAPADPLAPPCTGRPSRADTGQTPDPLQANAPVRVGLFGLFDLPRYGNLLLARVLEHALHRRVPGLALSLYSPLGWSRRVAQLGNAVPEPFGEWTAVRRSELAAGLDLAIVAGTGEPFHLDDEHYAALYAISHEQARRIAPSRFLLDATDGLATGWSAVTVPRNVDEATAEWLVPALARHAYISVSDEPARRRLNALAPMVSVEVVPDPSLTVAELLDRDVLDRRLRQLRAVGCYPPHGRPVVVQGSREMETQAGEIASQVDSFLAGPAAPEVVLVSLGPEGDDFADALRAALRRPVYVVDSRVAIEDVAAAIAQASLFVGESVHGIATAAAFGKRVVALDLPCSPARDHLLQCIGGKELTARGGSDLAAVLRQASTAQPPAAPEPVLRQLQAHFDRLAEIAVSRAAGRLAGAGSSEVYRRRIAALEAEVRLRRRAQRVVRERLACERGIFAEAVNALAGDGETPARLVADNARLRRLWADERSSRVVAVQRAEAAEARLAAIEALLDRARDERTLAQAELERLDSELRATRQELAAASEENRQHCRLLRTRLLSTAMRVQRHLAAVRRRR